MPDIDLDGYEQVDWSQAPLFAQDGRGVGWRVLGLMLYPDDTEKRHQVIASLYARQLGQFPLESLPLHKEADGSVFDPIRWYLSKNVEPFGGLRAATDAPSSIELTQEIERAAVSWSQTGTLLRIIHIIDRHHPDVAGGASVNKAVEIFAHVLGPNAGIPVNPTDIRTAWSAFRRVAHLCAAFVTTQITQDYEISGNPLPRAPCFPFDLAEFLAVARAYQEFGLRFKPRGRQDPLLPSDLWSVPDAARLRPATLAHPPLPSVALAALHAYRAPVRVT